MRSPKFVLFVVLFLAVIGTAALGWKLYQKYPEDQIKNTAGVGLLPRDWLIKYFANDNENDAGVGGPDGDPDGDILTNMQEFYFNTNPANPDTDGDGQIDGVEVAVNLNPNGEGELYSTEFAKRIANQYLDQNQLEEFKRENIEQQVLGILQPPKPEDVQIEYADPQTLNVSSDNTAGGADKYLAEMERSSERLDIDPDLIGQALDNPSSFETRITPGLIYESISEIRKIKVPSDFLLFHQLHIAGLFAAGKIFEIAKTIDPLADVATQQDKIQAQYYQVAVIQKVDAELRTQAVNLKPRYNEIIQKYESQF